MKFLLLLSFLLLNGCASYSQDVVCESGPKMPINGSSETSGSQS